MKVFVVRQCMDVYSFLKASFASKEKNIVHEGRGGKPDGVDPLPLQTLSAGRCA